LRSLAPRPLLAPGQPFCSRPTAVSAKSAALRREVTFGHGFHRRHGTCSLLEHARHTLRPRRSVLGQQRVPDCQPRLPWLLLAHMLLMAAIGMRLVSSCTSTPALGRSAPGKGNACARRRLPPLRLGLAPGASLRCRRRRRPTQSRRSGNPCLQ
jgi:hypothetical protein